MMKSPRPLPKKNNNNNFSVISLKRSFTRKSGRCYFKKASHVSKLSSLKNSDNGDYYSLEENCKIIPQSKLTN